MNELDVSETAPSEAFLLSDFHAICRPECVWAAGGCVPDHINRQ